MPMTPEGKKTTLDDYFSAIPVEEPTGNEYVIDTSGPPAATERAAPLHGIREGVKGAWTDATPAIRRR